MSMHLSIYHQCSATEKQPNYFYPAHFWLFNFRNASNCMEFSFIMLDIVVVLVVLFFSHFSVAHFRSHNNQYKSLFLPFFSNLHCISLLPLCYSFQSTWFCLIRTPFARHFHQFHYTIPCISTSDSTMGNYTPNAYTGGQIPSPHWNNFRRASTLFFCMHHAVKITHDKEKKKWIVKE